MVAIDTNVWVYFLTEQDKKKKEIAGELIASLSPEGLIISNQIFKEIAKVLTVNLNVKPQEAIKILELIEGLSTVIPEMPKDIKLSIKIKEKYNLQFFDSVIYAFCLNNNVSVLISEDVPVSEINYNGKTLRLINPFG